MTYLQFRMKEFTGDGSIMTWIVPFQARSKEDIFVYQSTATGEGQPSLWTEGVDYNFTATVTIPISSAAAEQFTMVTLNATVNGRKYTVIRVSSRTQPKNFVNAVDPNVLEYETRSVSYQSQETIVATLETFQADGARIQVLAAPVESKDMATHMYMQARHSLGGYIPPTYDRVDQNSALAAHGTDGSVYWKRHATLPFGSAGKVIKVSQSAEPVAVAEGLYAPVFPTVPKFLSTNSAGDDIEWRVVSDLPDPGNVPDYYSIISQEGGTVTWEETQQLPVDPDQTTHANKYYILSLWSGENAKETKVGLPFDKETYIDSNNPTTSYGSATSFNIMKSSTRTRQLLIEVDVSSLELNPDAVVKAELSLHKLNGIAGTNAFTFIA